MPVRVTPSGPILLCWDADADEWVSLRQSHIFPLLGQFADVEPATTMKDIFGIVEKDRALKDFLAEYCSCNIDGLHGMAAGPAAKLTVTDIIRIDDGTFSSGDTMPADFVTLERDAIVYTDEIGELRFSVHRSAFIRSRTHDIVGTPVRLSEDTHDVTGYISAVAKLPIRVTENIVVEDLNRPTGGGSSDFESFFDASMRWTLLDILSTIYSPFSEPMFDPRYQAEIDDNEDYFRRLREGREKQDDDDKDKDDGKGEVGQ